MARTQGASPQVSPSFQRKLESILTIAACPQEIKLDPSFRWDDEACGLRPSKCHSGRRELRPRKSLRPHSSEFVAAPESKRRRRDASVENATEPTRPIRSASTAAAIRVGGAFLVRGQARGGTFERTAGVRRTNTAAAVVAEGACFTHRQAEDVGSQAAQLTLDIRE
jgi:hypothetical protein